MFKKKYYHYRVVTTEYGWRIQNRIFRIFWENYYPNHTCIGWVKQEWIEYATRLQNEWEAEQPKKKHIMRVIWPYKGRARIIGF